MNSISGKIPYPPTINKYWHSRDIKDPYTGEIKKIVGKRPEVKKYMQDVAYLLMHQKIHALIGSKFKLEIFIYPPDKKVRDIDNLLKAILDAFQNAKIIENDFYIDTLYVERREVRKWGEIEFILSAI